MQANIFFFVTTVVVVLLASASIGVLIYVALIARDIRSVTKKIKEEGNATFENIKEIRNFLMSEKHRVFDMFSFFGGIIQQVVDTKKDKGAKTVKSKPARKKRSTRRATPKEE